MGIEQELQRKRAKAERYVTEPDRFVIRAIKIEMRSEHGTRSMRYVGGKWHCDCDFFKGQGTCSHTMAAELLLKDFTLKQPLDDTGVVHKEDANEVI